MVSMMSGPTHSKQQQPQPSSCHLWQSQQSTSQEHVGVDIDGAGMAWTKIFIYTEKASFLLQFHPMYPSLSSTVFQSCVCLYNLGCVYHL